MNRIGRIMTIPDIMQVRVLGPRTAAAAAAGWWVVAGKTCVAAYQAKNAASLAASYTNLANPGTYDAAPGVAPSWASATGWTFDGATQYLATGVNYNQTYTVLCRVSGWTGGMPLASASLWLYIWQNGGTIEFAMGGSFKSIVATAAGVFGVTDAAAYKDGEQVAAMEGGAHGSSAVYIASNEGAYWLAANMQALAIYSDTLTAGEVAAVSAAMAAL